MANELASLYRAENSEDLSKSSITFGDPNPRAIYSGLYETIPWPSTIPLPEKVGFKWNYRSRTLRGCCRVSIRVIELSFIYQHPALSQELVHIIAHEMAHFIWGGHPRPMKDFLKDIGVLEEYVHSESRIYSEVLNVVNAKLRPARFWWRCPACGHTFFSNRRPVARCGRCNPQKWDEQFRLVFGNSADSAVETRDLFKN